MVSLFVGKGHLIDLKKIFKYLITDSIIIGTMFSATLLPFRHILFKAYTNECEISNLAVKYFELLIFANFLDNIGEVLINTLKGLRRVYT